MLGGVIAVLAIILRKELLIPVFADFPDRKFICNASGWVLNTEKENTG
jgi:hypothetical protein